METTAYTCPHCGKPILLPEGLTEFSCMYCGARMTLEQLLPGNPVVALTGPSHAEEVSRGIPTAVLAALLALCLWNGWWLTAQLPWLALWRRKRRLTRNNFPR